MLACRTLFGPSSSISPRHLGCLDPARLREAYRLRALETHPDRARIVGRKEEELAEAFKDVSLAYRRLLAFMQEQEAEELSGEEAAAEEELLYWEGDIPPRRLLIGQFLFYAGIVSRQGLEEALRWQRGQRPSFGRIAGMWEYLSPSALERLLLDRLPGERLGEAALRLGLLTPFQLNAVLGFQRMLQRPLGEFFVEKGLLLPEEMRFIARRHRQHNALNGGEDPYSEACAAPGGLEEPPEWEPVQQSFRFP